MTKYLNISLILISYIVNSQDLKPLGVYDNLISHNYYSLSYSEEHKQAEWVYYKLHEIAATYNNIQNVCKVIIE